MSNTERTEYCSFVNSYLLKPYQALWKKSYVYNIQIKATFYIAIAGIWKTTLSYHLETLALKASW